MQQTETKHLVNTTKLLLLKIQLGSPPAEDSFTTCGEIASKLNGLLSNVCYAMDGENTKDRLSGQKAKI